MMHWTIEDYFMDSCVYVPSEIKDKIKEKITEKWVGKTRNILEKKLVTIFESHSYHSILLNRAITAFKYVNKIITGEEYSLNLPEITPLPTHIPTKRLKVIPIPTQVSVPPILASSSSSESAIIMASNGGGGGIGGSNTLAVPPTLPHSSSIADTSTNVGMSVFGLSAASFQSIQGQSAFEDYEGYEYEDDNDDEEESWYYDELNAISAAVAGATESSLPVNTQENSMPVAAESSISDEANQKDS